MSQVQEQGAFKYMAKSKWYNRASLSWPRVRNWPNNNIMVRRFDSVVGQDHSDIEKGPEVFVEANGENGQTLSQQQKLKKRFNKLHSKHVEFNGPTH